MKKNMIITALILTVFAVGFCASDDSSTSDSSNSTTTITDSEEKQEEETKHEFFTPGYIYSASYNRMCAPGWGASSHCEYEIVIDKDGTAEITQTVKVLEGDFPGTDHKKWDCEINKKEENDKGVTATWYDVVWTSYSTYGGSYSSTEEVLHVDENGNIYDVWVSDETAISLAEAVSKGKCISGRFLKRPI